MNLPPHEDWCCANGCAGWGYCTGCSGTEADCSCLVLTVREAKAEAWDEGEQAGWRNRVAEEWGETQADNPYRD